MLCNFPSLAGNCLWEGTVLEKGLDPGREVEEPAFLCQVRALALVAVGVFFKVGRWKDERPGNVLEII